MSKNILLPIDYDKLTTELRKRGMGPTEASREMGFSDAYLSKARNKPELRNPTIVALEKAFGISYDAIKPDEPSKPAPVTLEQAQDGVVDALHRIEAKMADRPTLSAYDKLALENTTKATDRLATLTNAQSQAILALADAIKRIADKADRLEQLLSDPTAMYKAIFIPVYSAVKCADAESAEQAKSAVPRRMDGSIDYSKMARRP